ncbi:MAG: hypothetical protein ABDH63_03885 [Candidatus Caldarchaeales archaeon]
MQGVAEVLGLVWPVVIAVAVIVVLLTVISGLKRITAELKLMREALQITVKPVQPEEERSTARPQPEVPAEPAPPQQAAQAVMVTPPPPPPEQPEEVEVGEISDLKDLLKAFDLGSVLLFDSAGHVIDHEGEEDPEKLAALLAEAFSVVMMANDRARSFAVFNGGVESVVRVATIDEREIYAHFRTSRPVGAEELRKITERLRVVLARMLEVR